MKYIWFVLAIIFAVAVIYEFASEGTWNSLRALWSVVCLLEYKVHKLEEEI